MLVVPELVRQRADSLGDVGRSWLRALPSLVDARAAAWDLQLGATFDGGTTSLVVAATDPAGTECVLKVGMPFGEPVFDTFERSVLVHRLADGRGCARLLDHDVDTRAMLLERLGPDLHELGLAIPDVLDAVATTLRSFWRPVDDAIDLPTGADQASWLAEYIESSWDELAHPCPRAVIERALDYCRSRAEAFDRSAAVLVHGDAHGWNTLRSDDGFRMVDPEGLISEPAHDLGVAMREYNEPLLAGDTKRLTRERAELLADRCDVDVAAVWEWGLIERVSTGLANLRDFEAGGDEFLEVAHRCL